MSHDPTLGQPDTPETRVARALFYAEFGTIDGGHHKQWVIDQMVRALTGCPHENRTGTDVRSIEYSYPVQGESAEYHAWCTEIVTDYLDADEWEGIAP